MVNTIKHVKGDLLNSDCDYICHQVNCQGRMGAGIAKQIRDRFPEVYEKYMKRYDDTIWRGYSGEHMLGSIDVVRLRNSDRFVINMYSQADYGYGKTRYTSYDAFEWALKEIKLEVPIGYTIGFPKNIGCGLGGGDWRIISILIESVLGDDYDVYIYEL